MSYFRSEYYFFTLTLEKLLHQLQSLYIIFYQYILFYYLLKILIEMVVASKLLIPKIANILDQEVKPKT